MDAWTTLLTQSLLEAPLLVADLPEAQALDRRLLGTPDSAHQLNFSQKLGHVYEDALDHLIRQSEQLSLVASHLQVFDGGGITLGEMDFLVRDTARARHFQLELAVKFYLGIPTAAGWIFPGPDPRDNWANKLARMRSHQLKLADCPQAKDLLRDRFGIEELSIRQLIYGRVFVPMGIEAPVLPQAMRPDALRGRWLSRSQWPQWFGPAQQLRLIPKALWPVPVTPSLIEHLPVIPQSELFQQAQTRCVMFASEASPQPFFLVPDCWPGTP